MSKEKKTYTSVKERLLGEGTVRLSSSHPHWTRQDQFRPARTSTLPRYSNYNTALQQPRERTHTHTHFQSSKSCASRTFERPNVHCHPHNVSGSLGKWTTTRTHIRTTAGSADSSKEFVLFVLVVAVHDFTRFPFCLDGALPLHPRFI